MKPNSLLTRRGAGALTLAALLALTVGCASKPDVRSDQDPTADLTNYKTFAFSEPAAADRSQYTALLSTRLKATTREQLERQHYAYSERDPDLRVNLHLVVTERHEVRSAPSVRIGWRGWASQHIIESVDYRLGTLVIDLVDAKRNALVWHGVAEGRLDAKAIEQPGPAIDAAVGEIFTRFPRAKS